MKKNKKAQVMIACILLVGFIVSSIISYLVARSSVRDQIINKQLPLTSDNVYSEVQNDLLRPIFISSLMASDTFLRDWVIDGEKSPLEIEKYLNEIKLKYGVFSSFFVSDKTLNYYYSEGVLKKVDKNSIRDTWYFRVREMKNNYEINVDPDMANRDSMTIFINYKVFDYKGNYLGVAGVGLKVDEVNKIINAYQKKFNSGIHFVDKNGKVRLSSRLRIGSTYSSEFNPKENEVASYSYTNERENILVNVRYIPEFKWYLVVEQSDKKDIENLLKTLFFNILITLVLSALVIVIITKKWQEYHRELEELALTDKLTGCFNRQAFEIDTLEFEKINFDSSTSCSLMIFDIDNFKNINDTYGHHQGDQVIKTIADLAKDFLDHNSKIYRWGGDEFLVLFKNKTLEDSYEIAEQLRENINKISLLNPYNVSISGGIGLYKPKENIDDFLKNIDALLYNSKLNGKNRITK